MIDLLNENNAELLYQTLINVKIKSLFVEIL